ncbi:MAG: ribbon-helix-helix protein [Ktedonobacterales bacterium]
MATGMEHTGEAEQHSDKRTRLVIDISPELRRRIKLAAARQDQSVRQYVEDVLDKAVPAESLPVQQLRPIPAEWVEQLRQLQDEWARTHPGVVLDNSVDLIREMREERTRHLESL